MTYATPYLHQIVTVKVDRQLGTNHPKHGFVYCLNYGFIPGTTAPDGEEIDAYILGVSKPIEEFEGEVIAVIHRTNDDDDKLVVVPIGTTYSDDQIKKLTQFQERFFESEILR